MVSRTGEFIDRLGERSEVCEHARRRDPARGFTAPVHEDGAVAERFADGPGNGFEQRGEILTRPQ